MTTRPDARSSAIVVQPSSPSDDLLLVGVAGLLPIALAVWLVAALPALLSVVIR